MKTKSATKLSKETLQILKNFASLNSNLLVKPGNRLVTVTPYKNVMAEAIIQEEFDTEFAIWDLSKFLGIVSMFEDPDFIFHDKYVEIEGSNHSTVKYFYCDPKLITSYPTKNLVMPRIVLELEFSERKLTELQKAASILQIQDLKIFCDSGSIMGEMFDSKDSTTNTYSVEFPYDGELETDEFEFHFKIENLKFIPGAYKAQFSENIVSKFICNNTPISYWVAMEPSSNYGK
jgi:hypothetical protein